MKTGASTVELTVKSGTPFTDFRCPVCSCLLCSYRGEDAEVIAKCVKCKAFRNSKKDTQGSSSKGEDKTPK